MLIREYTESDLDALRRIHAAQGFEYPFPNLDDPLFVSKLILEDSSGRIAMAALARLTCEMYLLVNREEHGSSVGARHAVPGAKPWQQRAIDEGVIPSEPASAGDEGSLLGVGSAGLDTKRDSSSRQNTKRALLGMTPRTDSAPPRNDTSSSRERQRDHARTRFAQFLALHRAGEQDLLARGLEDAHAWLPPEVARRFGRRLEALGWVRDDSWTPYSRRLFS